MERNDLIERLIRASKEAYDKPDGEGLEMADLLARAFSTIASLSEALAEAEKKGDEVRLLEWDRGEACALGLQYGVKPYRDPTNEDPAYAGEWLALTFSGSWAGRFPSEDDAKAAAQENFETRVRAWLAPPRDLSQGVQHGCA